MFGVSEEVGEDLSKFGVHYLRSGRAKDAANSNIPNRLFKAHERWKSETVAPKTIQTSLAFEKSLGSQPVDCFK